MPLALVGLGVLAGPRAGVCCGRRPPWCTHAHTGTGTGTGDPSRQASGLVGGVRARVVGHGTLLKPVKARRMPRPAGAHLRGAARAGADQLARGLPTLAFHPRVSPAHAQRRASYAQAAQTGKAGGSSKVAYRTRLGPNNLEID